MKKINKAKVITVASTIALILAIPQMHEYANLLRSEPAWGGEAIAWMIPGLLFILCRTLKEAMEN